MQKTIKTLVLPLALASLASWQAAAQSPAAGAPPAEAKPALKATDLFPDTVVAKGKGFEIKRSQLDEEVSRFKAEQAGRGRPIQTDDSSMVDRYVLNQMLQVKLLASTATDAEKAEAKGKAEKRFGEIKAQLGDEALNRELKLMNTTHEELVAKWTELAAAETAAKRQVKTSVSDEEVKKYFEDHQAKFEQPEMVRASHILLATQDSATREELPADKKAAKLKQAQELLKRARAGEDFAKLAKQYSEDPGSKNHGGEYQFARGQMVKEFENTAFSLNTNQISDVVTTSYGYHIIKLSEKIPARKAGLNDEVVVAPAGYLVLKDCWRDPETSTNALKVSALIRQSLEGQEFQKELPAFLEKLRKDQGLEILDEKLKSSPEESAGASGAKAAAEAADKPKAK